MKGGRGLLWSPLPASESLPLTILIPPPQAKLNLSVRALESSAPDLQVANGSGRMGQNRWALEEDRAAALRFLLCLVPLEGEGEGGKGSDH